MQYGTLKYDHAPLGANLFFFSKWYMGYIDIIISPSLMLKVKRLKRYKVTPPEVQTVDHGTFKAKKVPEFFLGANLDL